MKRMTPKQLDLNYQYDSHAELRDYIAHLENALDQLVWTKSLNGEFDYCRHCRVLRGKAHGVNCIAGKILGK